MTIVVRVGRLASDEDVGAYERAKNDNQLKSPWAMACLDADTQLPRILNYVSLHRRDLKAKVCPTQ